MGVLGLVLHEGQTIRIGTGITVYVDRARNGTLRVGVRAPGELRIDRLDSAGNAIAPEKGKKLLAQENGR